MAKNNGNGDAGSKGRFGYPCHGSELDAANQRAHIPHKIPDQSEKGRDALVSGHRSVKDVGMLSRPDSLPGAQSTPIDGSVDVPYQSFPVLRK